MWLLSHTHSPTLFSCSILVIVHTSASSIFHWNLLIQPIVVCYLIFARSGLALLCGGFILSSGTRSHGSKYRGCLLTGGDVSTGLVTRKSAAIWGTEWAAWAAADTGVSWATTHWIMFHALIWIAAYGLGLCICWGAPQSHHYKKRWHSLTRRICC